MLKQLVQTGALHCGLSINGKVADAQVQALLARLRPVDVGIELLRLGGEADGGYLVPDDLASLAACFSPGVDVTASFEEAMIARGVPCFLADASVSGPPFEHELIAFEKKFLGVVNDETTVTLDRWVGERVTPDQGDLLLQMDIEGHEWSVLLNCPEVLLGRFRIMVLELHGLHHCFNQVAYQLIDACLDRLGRLFYVVHAHPNNAAGSLDYRGLEIPHLLEVTLLRRDRAAARGPARRFPHPLDRPNVPTRPDRVLPACMIGGQA